MTQINRREFIKLSGATAALAVTPSIVKAQGGGSFEASVAIVGGGFAGATLAKYLRLWSDGKIQVTMIDKNPDHVSCVLSNLVLNDRLQLDDITQSYAPLEDNHGVIVREGLVTDVTGDGVKTVHLDSGETVDCDYVVLAPGIEFVDIPGLKNGDVNSFDQIPHAWIAGPQTELLRDQLHAMQQGDTFVMTVPQSPYRCPPGPYERACVVADYIKREKGGGKVIVLDPHSEITIEKETFEAAFNGIYKDIVEYVPNAILNAIEIDPVTGEKVAKTSAGDFSGKVINVIPTHKAGKIVEDLGLLPMGERFAPVDAASYESTVEGKSGIYVVGDANASGQPKSGHMANAQAKVCVDAIIRTIAGKTTSEDFVHDPARLKNIKTNSACYSPITYDEASWLSAVFYYETADNSMKLVKDSFASSNSPHWSNDNFEDMFEWAQSLFRNTFG